MRRWFGQAGRLARAVGAVALALFVLAAAGLGALAVRLHAGPLPLDWVARRLEAALARGDHPLHLSIGSAELAWEGFHHGFESPLDLRLENVSARNGAGENVLTIPHAFVALSLSRLLIGEIAPRDLDVALGTIRLYYHPSGLLALSSHREETSAGTAPPAPGAGGIARLLDETGISLDALRRLRITALSIVVSRGGSEGGESGTWELRGLRLTYRRFLLRGRIEGEGEASLAAGGGEVALHATLDAPDGVEAPWRLRLESAPVVPAAFAKALPTLAPLARFVAPLHLAAEARVTMAGLAGPVKLNAGLDPGALYLGPDPLAVEGGTVAAELDVDGAALRVLGADFVLDPAGGGATRLHAAGTFRFGEEPRTLSLELAFDRADLSALGRLWPEALAPHARAWVTGNVTAGVASGGHFELTLALPRAGEARISAAKGEMHGEGLRITWLDTLPPLVEGKARLLLLDPDTLEIDADSASVAAGGGTVRLGPGSVVRVSGLAAPDQNLALDLMLSGGLDAALSLLAAPRLHLLAQAPDLARPGAAGLFSGKLHLALPLKKEIKDEDISLAAEVKLTGARLPRLVLGRDLDDGEAQVRVTESGMSAEGQAMWAAMPVKFALAADFTKGSGDQEVLRVAGELTGGARGIAAFGVDPRGRFSGSFPLDFTYTARRDGIAEVALRADFTPARLAPAPLAWEKPPGLPARLSADIRLDHDHLRAIEGLDLEGGGAFCQGEMKGGGQAPRLDLVSCRIGPSDFHGEVDFPLHPGDPYRIQISGSALDLSARASAQDASAVVRDTTPSADGDEGAGRGAAAEGAASLPPPHASPVFVHARFDTVAVARAAHDTPSLRLAFVDLSADDDGSRRWNLALSGLAGPRTPFQISVKREGNGRDLAAEASDAGALARALGLLSTMEGGRLSLHGRFDDARPLHPLNGTLAVDDFRLIRAPLALKLLQAMTLYGMVGQMEHEGIHFDHLVVPFTYASSRLRLVNARMWNNALGFTAEGEIALDRKTMDLKGTIIPAYYFNSLLGRLPVIGHLFSPEKGGGLVAARYTAEGKLDDPKVSVNPLSALTPGITRDLFNLFQ
jgi:hypothetical protein